MIPVPGSKGPLKPQGTVNSMKQLRIDHKKWVTPIGNQNFLANASSSIWHAKFRIRMWCEYNHLQMYNSLNGQNYISMPIVKSCLRYGNEDTSTKNIEQ